MKYTVELPDNIKWQSAEVRLAITDRLRHLAKTGRVQGKDVSTIDEAIDSVTVRAEVPPV